MRQVVLADVRKIEYIEVPKPKIRPGWVIVKLLRCGLCGTDVHNYYLETIFGKDRYPFHMGHETCGLVDEIGEGVEGLQVGDTVVINPFWTCGVCPECLMGHNNNCEHLNTIGLSGPSGNSEYTMAPAASVLKVTKDIDPTLLAFTEPLGTLIYAMDKIKLLPVHDVLILGAGAIGMLLFQMLRNEHVRSLSVGDIVDEKLEFAKKLGAERVINTAKEEDTRKYDVLIDCTGNAQEAGKDFGRMKFGGQLLIYGVCPIDSTVTFSPFDMYKKDLSVHAAFALNHSAFQRALAMIESGRIDVKPLVAGIYPVGKLEECIKMVKAGKVNGKIVIDTTRF